MLRRVALVRTDVSDELSASFIRVTGIDELGTTIALSSNRSTLRRNTKYCVSLIVSSSNTMNTRSWASSSLENGHRSSVPRSYSITVITVWRILVHKYTASISDRLKFDIFD
jgi:hypothetical protein